MVTLYEQLQFSHNWNNKLTCSAFTTFRLSNVRKYQIGKRLSIMLKGKHLKDVQILDIKTLKLNQVNEFIARIDTGYSLAEFKEIIKKMYKDKNIDFDTAYWDLVLCHEIPATTTKTKVEQLEMSL